MPQTIAKIGRERSISALTRNLFIIDARADPQATKRAEAALLKANPHLKNATGFKSGARVIIPGNIRLKLTDRVEKPETSLNGLLKEASRRLELADETAREAFSRSNTNIDTAMATLKNRKFQQVVAKQSKKGSALLKASTKNQTKQLEKNKEQEENIHQIIKDTMIEIEALQKLATRPDEG